MRRFVYDYYVVDVPGDAFDDKQYVMQQAISEARERTKIYAMPASWTAKVLSGEIGSHNIVVKVTRKRLHRVRTSKT